MKGFMMMSLIEKMTYRHTGLPVAMASKRSLME